MPFYLLNLLVGRARNVYCWAVPTQLASPTNRPGKILSHRLAIGFYGSGSVKAGVRVRHGYSKSGITNFGSQRMLSVATESSRIMYDSICEIKTSSTHEGPKSIAWQLIVAGMKHSGRNIANERAR